MKRNLPILCGVLAAMLFAAAPAAGREPANIIRNGDFEEPGSIIGIPGWNVAIMGYMPRVVDRDENGKAIFNYICGCGENLGPAKPWAGMRCPACYRYSVAEETGDWYNDNEAYVKIVPGRTGNCCAFNIPKDVGENEGVRCVSDLVRIKRDWPYKLTANVMSKGATMMIFVEGYRIVDDEQVDVASNADPEEYRPDAPEEDAEAVSSVKEDAEVPSGAQPKPALKPKKDEQRPESLGDTPKLSKLTRPNPKAVPTLLTKNGKPIVIEKKYRVNVNVGTPGAGSSPGSGWGSIERVFIPPARYYVDFIQVKLYAYFPGECFFDNIVVRPLTPAEAQAFMSKQKNKKDSRFR